MSSSTINGENKAATAKLIDLNRPEKLSDVRKRDLDDCLPCKLMGKNRRCCDETLVDEASLQALRRCLASLDTYSSLAESHC